MAVMAKWHIKKWQVSPDQIKAINGLTASVELDTENSDDKAGSPSTSTKALKLQGLNLDFDVSAIVGCDVRTEYESWVELIGVYAPFYLGDRRFGPANMQLTGVQLAESTLNDFGKIVKGRIVVTLKEYSEEASSKKATAGGTSDTPGISGNGVGERLSALDVKASPTAKELRRRKQVAGSKPIDVIQQYER